MVVTAAGMVVGDTAVAGTAAATKNQLCFYSSFFRAIFV